MTTIEQQNKDVFNPVPRFKRIERGVCPDCDGKLSDSGYCTDCHITPALDPDYQKWLEADKTNTMFHITLWETREVVKSVKNLNYAKKWARGRGHTGEDNPGLTGYPPIAYVADDNGDLVYNPRFGKNIRSDVGGLINAQPSNHF